VLALEAGLRPLDHWRAAHYGIGIFESAKFYIQVEVDHSLVGKMQPGGVHAENGFQVEIALLQRVANREDAAALNNQSTPVGYAGGSQRNVERVFPR